MTPAAVVNRRCLAAVAALALLVTPPIVFAVKAGPLAFFLGNEYPPGQAAYIMMRPAGHIAFVLVFFQIVLGAAGRPLARRLGCASLIGWHRALGLSALGFILLHPLLFVWARSLRSGALEVMPTFFPNPVENYWERMLFVGALGFYALLVGVAAAAVGPRLAPRAWRGIHAVNYAGFLLAFWHAISIGSETRIAPLPVLYWAMAIVAALLGGARFVQWARGRFLIAGRQGASGGSRQLDPAPDPENKLP